jgi:hypothetical protein
VPLALDQAGASAEVGVSTLNSGDPKGERLGLVVHVWVIGLIAGIVVPVALSIASWRLDRSRRGAAGAGHPMPCPVKRDDYGSPGSWQPPRVQLVRLPRSMFRQPLLDVGEQERRRWNASHVQGLTRGGVLVMTDRRLMFEPHKLDRALFAKPWSTALSGIRTIDVGAGILASGHGRRLHIDTGTDERFLVEDPESVARQIDQARR